MFILLFHHTLADDIDVRRFLRFVDTMMYLLYSKFVFVIVALLKHHT
jgi:hypothetical protein